MGWQSVRFAWQSRKRKTHGKLFLHFIAEAEVTGYACLRHLTSPLHAIHTVVFSSNLQTIDGSDAGPNPSEKFIRNIFVSEARESERAAELFGNSKNVKSNCEQVVQGPHANRLDFIAMSRAEHTSGVRLSGHQCHQLLHIPVHMCVRDLTTKSLCTFQQLLSRPTRHCSSLNL